MECSRVQRRENDVSETSGGRWLPGQSQFQRQDVRNRSSREQISSEEDELLDTFVSDSPSVGCIPG